MERQDRFLLATLLGLFSILLLLLLWSFVYDSQTKFLSGTQGNIQQEELPRPTIPPLRPSDPVAGSTDPKAVTIIVFSDFTCAYCRLSEGEMIRTITELKQPIRVVWRDLPISSTSREAMLGAIAGRCAQAQGKFWDFHDAVFASKKRLDETALHDLVSRASLDEVKFNTCFSQNVGLTDIQKDVALAHEHLIVSTPTFFVGNQPAVTGYVSANTFKTLIKKAQDTSK